MGYTNKTSHYDLPQWIAGDKPSWLGDVNTAMLNIDTAIAGADASASAAESSAAAAKAQVQAQEAKITKNTTDIQALTEQVANATGAANAALPKSGGAMTGPLTLAGAPTSDLMAATKKYVDDNSGKGALLLSGGTMTGPLTLSGDPTSNLMAATKQYVDGRNSTIYFTREPSGPSGGAAIINGTLFVSICSMINATMTTTTLFTASGNPLNLDVNKTYFLCSLLGITNSSVTSNAIRCKFDGSNTIIFSISELTEGPAWITSFSGKPWLA